jgi:hypothetical protein
MILNLYISIKKNSVVVSLVIIKLEFILKNRLFIPFMWDRESLIRVRKELGASNERNKG